MPETRACLAWTAGAVVSREKLATILEQVAAGDRVAFRSLYREAGPRLFSLCKRLMRDHDAAQDALQDVMVRIWEKSPLFDRARGDAWSWMMTVARSVVFNRLSDRPARTVSISNDDVASAVDRLSARGDPSLAPDLRRCLGGLKTEYRQCVVMAYHYGLTYEELAAWASVPLGTVKTWIHRAIGQLQTCLSQ